MKATPSIRYYKAAGRGHTPSDFIVLIQVDYTLIYREFVRYSADDRQIREVVTSDRFTLESFRATLLLNDRRFQPIDRREFGRYHRAWFAAYPRLTTRKNF